MEVVAMMLCVARLEFHLRVAGAVVSALLYLTVSVPV
jgi:hypothetical protein